MGQGSQTSQVGIRRTPGRMLSSSMSEKEEADEQSGEQGCGAAGAGAIGAVCGRIRVAFDRARLCGEDEGHASGGDVPLEQVAAGAPAGTPARTTKPTLWSVKPSPAVATSTPATAR